MNLFLVFFISAILLVAVMINLTVQNTFRRYFMGIGGVIAVLSGLFSYSYAYTLQSGFSLSVIVRVVLTVCRMFAGVNDYSSVSATPLFQNEFMLALFWLGHFLAFYITASAAIEVLGRRLMRYVRVRLLHRGDLCVIYGENDGAVALARQQKQQKQSVALIAEQDQDHLRNLAEDAGCAFFAGGTALCAAPEFLKKVGYVGEKQMFRLYCVHDDMTQNMRCAEAVCKALKAQEADPACTRLFILGVPEYRAEKLIANSDHYGFGSLFACEKYDLIARLLIRKAPPWTFLSYDGLARARSDFSVCVIGFGKMGRTILRHLVMFGQMEGSAFHADVFERDLSDAQGYMEACFPDLLQRYDIHFHSGDAKILYNKLSKNLPSMIVLCTGSPASNAELAADINQFYFNRVRKPVVVQCSTDLLTIDECEYQTENIDLSGIDRRAMILNHVYSQGSSPEADWRVCPPFNRASSRASADFYPAFLHAAGISRESALTGNWPPQKDVLENLAKTEHQRWCAFQFSMGYRAMSSDEFESRALRYKEGEKIRIGKNDQEKTHACLIPWDQLDALSARENAITGGNADYKEINRDNVLAVLHLIQEDKDSV